MKQQEKQWFDIPWLRLGLAFGLHLCYFIAIMLLERFGGPWAALSALLLLPLVVCGVNFGLGWYLHARTAAKAPSLLSPLGGFALAGALVVLVNGLVNGFTLDVGVLLFDAFALLGAFLGALFGVRVDGMRRILKDRRTRFDD